MLAAETAGGSRPWWSRWRASPEGGFARVAEEWFLCHYLRRGAHLTANGGSAMQNPRSKSRTFEGNFDFAECRERARVYPQCG